MKITKTWNYKDACGGFTETKNRSSERTIGIDPVLNGQLAVLLKNLREDEPIFVSDRRVHNSQIIKRMNELCEEAEVPAITIHGLRHTHASLLIYEGVSIASVAKRLGHSKVATTQDTYLHIIKELEDKDENKILAHLSGLTVEEVFINA